VFHPSPFNFFSQKLSSLPFVTLFRIVSQFSPPTLASSETLPHLFYFPHPSTRYPLFLTYSYWRSDFQFSNFLSSEAFLFFPLLLLFFLSLPDLTLSDNFSRQYAPPFFFVFNCILKTRGLLPWFNQISILLFYGSSGRLDSFTLLLPHFSS